MLVMADAATGTDETGTTPAWVRDIWPGSRNQQRLVSRQPTRSRDQHIRGAPDTSIE